MQFSKGTEEIQKNNTCPNSVQISVICFFLTKPSQSIYIINSINNNTFM